MDKIFQNIMAGVNYGRSIDADLKDHGRRECVIMKKYCLQTMKELRAIDPRVTLVAAGGINPSNAGAYAATGVDGLATTAPFSAKPLDMSVRMRALDN